MAHRSLALLGQQASSHQFEHTTLYIRAVGMDNVLPPASIQVSNTFAQAKSLPQAKEWEAAMRKELSSLENMKSSI